MKSKESLVFIVIVAALSIALFAGGFWAINSQKARDNRDLQVLLDDLSNLENKASAEAGYARELPNADSLVSELERVGEQIRNDKKQITTSSNAVLAKYTDFQQRKTAYANAIESVASARNSYTNNYVTNVKEQLEKSKKDLDAAIKRNKSLSAQLGGALKQSKLAKADLEKMKAKLAEYEKSGKDLETLRAQLEQANGEKANLASLLEQSKKMLQEQEEKIAGLMPLNQKILNFRAQYQLRSSGKFIELGSSPENKSRQVDDLNFSFECGAAMFDNDDKDKLVYLTILEKKTNKPYRTYNRVAIRMQLDPKTNLYKAKQRYEVSKGFDDGGYIIRLFYKEKQVLEDYNFVID
ncbi:MAG: coiled-coil domain-containing protein [Thermoflexibacteraceae bacterium]